MKKCLLLGVILFMLVVCITGCEVVQEGGEYNYLVLVNKYTQLPDDWEENVELVDAKNAWKEDIKVEKAAYENYKKLKKALKDEGVTILLDSAYRSVKDQQNLWDEWSADPEKGPDYVRRFVAVPGYSEHHTGLAIDICIKKDGKLIYDNDEMIAEKEIFEKIHKKLADYGFILRYMEGREDSTGYTYEPWHLRYIGDKDIAKKIMKDNITFEEYLDSMTDLNDNDSYAIYRIEKTLQEYFKEVYGDQFINSRFNVKKIYNDLSKENGSLQLHLNKNDLAFEVEYQLEPSEEANLNELTIPDGEYDEALGWVTNIGRVGILKYKNGNYSIKNFGTGW